MLSYPVKSRTYLDGGLGHGSRDVSLEDVVKVRQEGQRHDRIDCQVLTGSASPGS